MYKYKLYRCLLTSLCFIVLTIDSELYAQCTPKSANQCKNVQVLCSLDELNGYTCKNTSAIPSPCYPLCSQGGIPHNTSWWGFVTQGGPVTITLKVGACNPLLNGMQFGVWGDCACREEIICNSLPCVPENSTVVVSANLKPCKLYYLWVDGCAGEVCDFTLNTTGGGPPSLTTLGFINNLPGKIFGPICTDACNLEFFVNPQPGGCEPTYVWTLDSAIVGGNTNRIRLDFPNEGDFELCVTAYIGNPLVGAICTKEATQCMTILVRKPNILTNQLRTFCNEEFKNLNDTTCVYNADSTYRCETIDSNCCKTIETGRYKILPVPIPADVLYVSCDGNPFMDVLGKTHPLCLNRSLINLSKSTNPFNCDSSIILTSIYPNVVESWKAQCFNGFVELSPNLSIINPCNFGETYQFNYKWYKKNDPSKTTIGTKDNLLVDAVNEDYCVEVDLYIRIGPLNEICTKTFCDTINENDLMPCSTISGDQVLCKSNLGSYQIDSLGLQNVWAYYWKIIGGNIISKLDSSSVEVDWKFNLGDSGIICASFFSDCGKSCERCLTVYNNPTTNAGQNDSICFFNYQLKGLANGGIPNWKVLSGPGNSTIINPNNDITNVSVNGKGTYTYELTKDFKGCISKDTVEITFWDAPIFNSVIDSIECDNTAEHYRIQIDAQNGDRSSWKIDGFSLPGGPLGGSFIGPDTWRTDWISDSIVRLIINDKHNCLPDTVNSIYECPCINSIGDFSVFPWLLCIDDTTQIVYNTGSGTPDGNDVIRFILYDRNGPDPRFGAPLRFNQNGRFVFDPGTMQLGKIYYIAVLMGNPDPNDPDKVLLNDRCLKDSTQMVVWFDYPQARIVGQDTLNCIRNTITLDGSGSSSGSGFPLNYLWSTTNGNILGSARNKSIAIDAPGTYKLLVSDTTSCTSEMQITIKADNAKPLVSIAPPQELNCNHDRVVLDGSASSHGSEYNIQWKGPGNISNGNTYQPTVDVAGLYHFIISNQRNGCADSFAVDVISDFRKPIPVIQSPGQLTCTVRQLDVDAGNSTGQSGSILKYNWQTQNGNIIAGQGTTTITVDKPGTYQLLLKDQNNGCDSVANLEVIEIENPLAGFDLNAKNPKCFGEQNGELVVNGIIANGPLRGLQYSLNNGKFVGNTTFSNLGQGKYQLMVKDINGCERDTTITLVEPDKLGMQVIKTIVVDLDSPVNLDSMLLSVAGGTKNYQDTSWYSVDENKNWPNINYLADTTRDFVVTVIDAAGCEIQDRVKVIVRIIKDVWWPTAFSPNKDNINDFWNLKGKRINNIRTLNIYDRWGEQVYTAQNIKDGNTDPNAGWNGELKGQKALPGVYVFYAEVEYVGSSGFDKYKGEFTLIR